MAFYGAGSMLGAGIYGLIGQAASVMGSAVWLVLFVARITSGDIRTPIIALAILAAATGLYFLIKPETRKGL